ncbi:unnamed protein product [Peniophora sp. CBMAI 1063]|nr:unnamed protein product [Peniophora sp. CBMAI 1063]
MSDTTQPVRKGANMPLLTSKEESRQFPPVGTQARRQFIVAAVEDFSRLYRASGGDVEKNELLLRSADHLNCSLFHAALICKDPELERLLFDTRIHDLYQDIVMDDDFFRQPLSFVDSVIGGLIRLVGDLGIAGAQHSRLHPFVAPLLRRAPALWESIWNRRQQLVYATQEEHQIVLSPSEGPAHLAGEPILQLLCVYNHFHGARAGSRSAPLSSYVPHVALYYPLSLATPEIPYEIQDHAWREALTCLPEAVRDDSARDALVRSVLMDNITASFADVFFGRFAEKLQSLPDDCGTNFERAFLALQTYRSLATCPLLHGALLAHEIHQTMVHAVSRVLRSNLDAQTVKTMVWADCGLLTGSLLQALIDSTERSRSSLDVYLRGEYVISEVARAVDLLSQEGVKLGPLKANIPGTRFENPVEQRLLDINRLIEALKRHKGRGSKPFLKSMKDGAMAEWWPSMQALQTVQYRLSNSPQRHMLSGVLRQWENLGKGLGLGEEEERKRFRREAAHRCSWYACEHHRSAPDASVVLKKCSGCGDSHYCSRECQRSDWNKGGHKSQCRRLKDIT